MSDDCTSLEIIPMFNITHCQIRGELPQIKNTITKLTWELGKDDNFLFTRHLDDNICQHELLFHLLSLHFFFSYFPFPYSSNFQRLDFQSQCQYNNGSIISKLQGQDTRRINGRDTFKARNTARTRIFKG